jgi:hypothetical protein
VCDGTEKICSQYCPVENLERCEECGGDGFKVISNLEYIRMIEMKEPFIEYDNYVHDSMLEL